jgi:hypothetical protein
VVQSYAASVSFVCVIIAAVSLVVFGYEVFRILAPGVFELSGTRVAAARVLLAALYLTFASAALIAAHARHLPTGGWGTAPPPDGGAPYGGAPLGPPVTPSPY